MLFTYSFSQLPPCAALLSLLHALCKSMGKNDETVGSATKEVYLCTRLQEFLSDFHAFVLGWDPPFGGKPPRFVTHGSYSYIILSWFSETRQFSSICHKVRLLVTIDLLITRFRKISH